MTKLITLGFCACSIVALAGCTPDYSPNTYNGSALQQANKVDTGVVIGYREVRISDDGTVGTVTGGAAGGILGAELGSPTVPTALAALSATVVGGVVGATIQHATGDTTGWEYIVREPKGDLVSVTQREPKPIAIGQKVLVIEGKQARIVPDYATAESDTTPAPKADEKHDQDKTAVAAPPAVPATTSPTPVTSTTVSGSTPVATLVPAPAPTPPPIANTASASPAPASADKAASDQAVPASTPPQAAPVAPAIPPAAAAPPPPPASAGSNANTSSPPS